jgi:hypothetical protein
MRFRVQFASHFESLRRLSGASQIRLPTVRQTLSRWTRNRVHHVA